IGDVLHDIFLPSSGNDRNDVPHSVSCDPLAGGQAYLTSDKLVQETLAPLLLLFYGEVEHTGFYEKNSHRTKIAKLLKFLWESPKHKPAFRESQRIKQAFKSLRMVFVMERLPAIRTVQLQMANHQEWTALRKEERETIIMKRILPLCNSVVKMLCFLNTNKDIRDMFLLPEMCPRLANMLLHVLTKFISTRGMDLKVDNPESYNFCPKDVLQDVCVVFSSFAAATTEFQLECARSEPLLSKFMTDPVLLPTSGHIIDRKTISQLYWQFDGTVIQSYWGTCLGLCNVMGVGTLMIRRHRPNNMHSSGLKSLKLKMVNLLKAYHCGNNGNGDENNTLEKECNPIFVICKILDL
ncbi:hypothetical protein HJC23_002749, partial [Cyclotella cryptica]